MFENLVSQTAARLIASDIKKGIFPNSVLFYGGEASGKLSAALETARVLGCTAEKKGEWTCTCASCEKNKALTSSNLLLIGPRDCFLEIAAAKDTFLKACKLNAKYLTAARYLYLRSIRKLTLRFNGLLLEGEANLSKIGSVIEDISENLEKIDFPRELPPYEELEKICVELNEKALKLEEDFLYSSIPIAQIRNMEAWARIKSSDGKKTVIIENADKMLPGVRNALLKILEEPPADCVFILLTSKRSAVMPTILSRVRTYSFANRTFEEQKNVIKLVFHNESFEGSIYDYLTTYLPVPAVKLKAEAFAFINGVAKNRMPDVSLTVKNCGGFKPYMQLHLFLNEITSILHPLLKSAAGSEAYSRVIESLHYTWENVTMYNQNPVSALENLVRELVKINITGQKIFLEAIA